MMHLLAVAALLLYLAAAVLYLAGIASRKTATFPAGSWSLKGGFAFHTLVVGLFTTTERMVFLESRADYFFWLSWLVPLAFFALGRKLAYPIIGAFVSSAALLLLTSSSYLVHRSAAPGASQAAQGDVLLIALHALPALLGEVSLVLAFIVSSAFIFQARRLKRKSLDALSLKGPSLEALEKLNHRFILAGFSALTIAVLTGSIWSILNGRILLGGDMAQWSAILAWILLAVILHSRVTLKWSAHRLSRVTVWVTGVFLFSVLLIAFLDGSVVHGSYY